MKIQITGIIDIQREINEICCKRRFTKAFDLPTGYKSPNVVVPIGQLILSNEARGLLQFLQIEKVIGKSGMEYNDYIFVSRKGKEYKGADCDGNNFEESYVPCSHST